MLKCCQILDDIHGPTICMECFDNSSSGCKPRHQACYDLLTVRLEFPLVQKDVVPELKMSSEHIAEALAH